MKGNQHMEKAAYVDSLNTWLAQNPDVVVKPHTDNVWASDVWSSEVWGSVWSNDVWGSNVWGNVWSNNVWGVFGANLPSRLNVTLTFYQQTIHKVNRVYLSSAVC